MAAENFKVKKGLEVGTGSTITSDGVNVTGIVTATQFKGDGSGLTNVVGSGSGVVVKDEGSAVGTAGTINFVGSGVAATLSAGQATITIDGGGLNDIVSDTTPQLGGNLDLNSKDITGSGDIDITGNLNISGISTFGGTLKVDSTLRSNALSISTSFPAIYLYDNTTGANDYRITNSDGSLKISDTTNSSDILHRFEIASDGNVGINSTSPSTKLEVVGENGSTATFKSVASPHLLVTSDANLNEHQYQSTRNGVTIKSTEARLDLIAEGSGTHAGSFLMRDNSHDGFGFVNDFTNKELQLKSFTASGIAFRINSTGFNVSRLDDCIVIKKDGSVKLFNDGNLRLETTGTGINIPEDTSTSTLTVQAQAIISGLLDVIGNANISNDLDVDGHTNLDNVSIAETLNVVGVSTFSKEVGISSALNVAGVSTFNDDTGANPDFVLQNRNGTFAIRDITSSPGVNRFFVNAANGDVTVTGNIAGDNSTNISGIASVTATSFHGSGAGLTSIPSAQLTGALPSLDGSATT